MRALRLFEGNEEDAVFRAAEGMILAAEVMSRDRGVRAAAAALALGRLLRALPKERVDPLLDLARASWEAAG